MAQTSLIAIQDQGNYSGPGGYRQKFVITLADFQAMGAVTTGDILLENLPPKSVVTRTQIKHTQAAAGTGPLTAATVVLKTSLSSTLGGAAFDVFQAVGATTLQAAIPVAAAGANGSVQNFGAITPLLAGIVLTGGNANVMTAGNVEIYVTYEVLPA